MCGRYSLAKKPDQIVTHFQTLVFTETTVRYNLAPGQTVPVILTTEADNDRTIKLMQWGLIPSWVNDIRKCARPINARSETAAQKPFFKEAMRLRRCIIPADGFYEWAKQNNRKQPFYFQINNGAIFGMAGLWEYREDNSGNSILSCTILTTQPNEITKPIHNRMPVILQPDNYSLWLDSKTSDPQKINHLLAPCPPEILSAYPVSDHVNSPKNDDPDCIEKILIPT